LTDLAEEALSWWKFYVKVWKKTTVYLQFQIFRSEFPKMDEHTVGCDAQRCMKRAMSTNTITVWCETLCRNGKKDNKETDPKPNHGTSVAHSKDNVNTRDWFFSPGRLTHKDHEVIEYQDAAHSSYKNRRISESRPPVSRHGVKTHTKKYTIFSCNKMAVSDHRPFSLILADEETTVLYTAIPNRINSKSIAETNVKG
jgi:hypothetical protein